MWVLHLWVQKRQRAVWSCMKCGKTLQGRAGGRQAVGYIVRHVPDIVETLPGTPRNSWKRLRVGVARYCH